MTTVFDAFPEGVETDAWTLYTVERGTEVGKKLEEYGTFFPIVSDGASGTLDNSPNADGVDADVLLYVKPEELPTTAAYALVARYIVADPDGNYFNIVQSGQGKNQETGEIEHVELALKMTEIPE